MVELQDAEGRVLEGYELKTGKTVTPYERGSTGAVDAPGEAVFLPLRRLIETVRHRTPLA